jgi:hypothetical protein
MLLSRGILKHYYGRMRKSKKSVTFAEYMTIYEYEESSPIRCQKNYKFF